MNRQADWVLEVVAGHPEGVTAQEIADQLKLDSVEVGDCIHALREQGTLVGVGGLWFTRDNWSDKVDVWCQALARIHQEQPAVPLVPAARVLPLGGKALTRAIDWMERAGLIRRRGHDIALAGFRPDLPAKQKAMVDRVAAHLADSSPRFVPPHRVSAELGVPVQAVERAISLGLDSGELWALGDRLVSSKAETALMVTACLQLPRGFAVADFRGLTGLNRKDATLHLDNWDARGVTLRHSDDTRTFSQEFEQRLRDIRLANDHRSD